MAYRSTITLSDRDQKILENFKSELGIESSSQAIAMAVQIADFIVESKKHGNDILTKQRDTGEISSIKILGIDPTVNAGY